MIYILTGPVHCGKTTSLKEVVRGLKGTSLTVGGFLTESIVENQENVGYDLLDLRENKSLPYIRRTGEDDWQKIGPFYFIPESLAKAREIILRDCNTDVLVIDEIGPLELSGKGLWPALKKVLFQHSVKLLLVVRANILDKFLKMMDNTEVLLFDYDKEGVGAQMIDALTDQEV